MNKLATTETMWFLALFVVLCGCHSVVENGPSMKSDTGWHFEGTGVAAADGGTGTYATDTATPHDGTDPGVDALADLWSDAPIPDDNAGTQPETTSPELKEDVPACIPQAEQCNGQDDDCDDEIDEDFPDFDGDWIADCIDTDDDNDGWMDQNDCAPLDAERHPSADEQCNGLDDDCDGEVDEGAGDADGDGLTDCVDPDDDNDGSPDTVDCEPVDPDVHPGQTELCNEKDDDCDGNVDEQGAEGCTTFYLDMDGDGYGVADSSGCLCGPTFPYTSIFSTDCDDDNITVSPGSMEECNQKDDDCDGIVDDGTCLLNCEDDSGCLEGWKCNVDTGVCYNLACLSQIEPGDFDPVQEWAWSGSAQSPAHHQVMASPVVADLDLDGLPEVIFNTFSGSSYNTNGVLRAIRGNSGQDVFATSGHPTYPGSTPAVGDVQGDGFPEIASTAAGNGVHVWNHEGQHLWSGGAAAGDAAMADLNGDGSPEVIQDYDVFSGTGNLLWSHEKEPSTGRVKVSVADLNGDGFLDLTLGARAYSPFTPDCPDAPCGQLLWDAGGNGGFTAIADMTGGGLPQVVAVRGGKVIVRDGATGAFVWEVNVPGGGGGPPNVADFDGDGGAELGIAGKDFYTVYDGVDGSIIWSVKTTDHSSSVTGSSVFDFDGDEEAEVVYNDEYHLRIYRGTDGVVLYSTPNPSGTLFEYPVIVDVDGDNNAEIVVAANDYAWGSHHGIRVFGDASDHWVSTRRIWNQHAYSITNVNVDGSIPAAQLPSWEAHNTYRCNLQMDYDPLASPDVLSDNPTVDTLLCPEQIIIMVLVRNIGTISLPVGLEVGFYIGDPQAGGIFAGTALTEDPLEPGSETMVDFVLDASLVPEPADIYIVVDPFGTLSECDEGNNTIIIPMVGC